MYNPYVLAGSAFCFFMQLLGTPVLCFCLPADCLLFSFGHFLSDVEMENCTSEREIVGVGKKARAVF